MQRLNTLNRQFTGDSNFNGGKVGAKRDDDIVIVGLARTAMTKAKRGPQRNTGVEAMLKPVLQAVHKQSGVDKALVDDIVIGNVILPGSAATNHRMASLLADYPETTSVMAINRLCSSGLQAVATVANQIRANEIAVGIGGGVESMSTGNMQTTVDVNLLSEQIFDHEVARDCLIPMGITSENVAAQHGITREQQDQLAVESHAKAIHANKMGWSQSEITPYKTKVTDKDGNETEVMVDHDDGPRPGTTLEKLGKLKAAFQKGGSTTAGNSSQMTDGAAAVMLTTRGVANKLGCKIVGRFVGYATAGVPPKVMGIGPAYAIPKALENCGLNINDIDVFEINEAFASQATYSVQKLGVPKEKLNPRGGALAVGHPLGMTGARMIVTLMSELERTNKKFGIVSMCIGTGMGAAGVFERE